MKPLNKRIEFDGEGRKTFKVVVSFHAQNYLLHTGGVE
jgi:hypothetical protein